MHLAKLGWLAEESPKDLKQVERTENPIKNLWEKPKNL